MVEVWQRMDLDFEAFVFIASESERDHWEYNIAGSSTEEKQEEVIRKLEGDYDAIVLIDFVVGWLPEEARNLLRSKAASSWPTRATTSPGPWKRSPTARDS